MQTDSWIGSLIWGRIGAAVLLMVAFGLQFAGISFDVEEQKQLFDAISMILASAGGILALFSKLREKKKAAGGK